MEKDFNPDIDLIKFQPADEALDFIASITSHIPNRNEQTIRYFGYYSNVCRGKRKKQAVELCHRK